MSFQDIAENVVQARKDAESWLHLIQTSTNNISTNHDYQCAMNGYLSGYKKGAVAGARALLELARSKSRTNTHLMSHLNDDTAVSLADLESYFAEEKK